MRSLLRWFDLTTLDQGARAWRGALFMIGAAFFVGYSDFAYESYLGATRERLAVSFSDMAHQCERDGDLKTKILQVIDR